MNLLTTKDLEKILNLSRKTILKLRKENKIEEVSINGRVFFTKEMIENFIQRQSKNINIS
jgi:hypothetical protein